MPACGWVICRLEAIYSFLGDSRSSYQFLHGPLLTKIFQKYVNSFRVGAAKIRVIKTRLKVEFIEEYFS